MVDADQGEVAEIDATVEVEVAPKNDRFVGAAVPRRRQGGAAVPRRRQGGVAACGYSRNSVRWLGRGGGLRYKRS